MKLVVRAARAGDAAAVAGVLARSFPALMRGAYPPELLARALPLMTRPHPRLLGSGTWFLAELDGEPAGCGGWSLDAPGSRETRPGVAHIRHFATAAEHAGRGVGRAIFARCEAQARPAGVERFECLASLNGEGFYAALGFERVGPVDVPMGPEVLFPSVLMTREI
jgi:GNAT superfamily N-acetyltransferase